MTGYELRYPLSILLLAAIGATLISPHGGLQFNKQRVGKVPDVRGLTHTLILSMAVFSQLEMLASCDALVPLRAGVAVHVEDLELFVTLIVLTPVLVVLVVELVLIGAI